MYRVKLTHVLSSRIHGLLRFMTPTVSVCLFSILGDRANGWTEETPFGGVP